MHEEIEYAEMLEIPVSTVNVVRRRRKKAKKEDIEATPESLKNNVIAQVNDKLEVACPPEAPLVSAQEEAPADPLPPVETEASEGYVDFDGAPDRIDTVRLYANEKKRSIFKWGKAAHQTYLFEDENEKVGGRYALNEDSHTPKAVRILLGAEFVAACVLCGAIFFTNVFMPGSGINTFFRAMNNPASNASKTDSRIYSDFQLSSVVNSLSDTQLTLSETGVLSFLDECCVYPAADGKVSEITAEKNGRYTVKISHSDSFTGVIYGLDYVYYAVGDDVKANVPVGFSKGETEVQVTMYSAGELLNCFEINDENCLVWVTQE